MSLAALIALSILIYLAVMGVFISLIGRFPAAGAICLLVALGSLSLIRLITSHHPLK